jgi:FlaA1/EpsC-like NDP-sugar epimerase
MAIRHSNEPAAGQIPTLLEHWMQGKIVLVTGATGGLGKLHDFGDAKPIV